MLFDKIRKQWRSWGRGGGLSRGWHFW